MKYWLYVSLSKSPALSVDDAIIYLQSRNRNLAQSITGYLHREHDCYTQFVEGPPHAIDALIDRIRRDPRHRILREIAEGEIATRRFRGWDMAFSNEGHASFRTFQNRHGGTENIRDASEAEILRFMECTARDGLAKNLKDDSC